MHPRPDRAEVDGAAPNGVEHQGMHVGLRDLARVVLGQPSRVGIVVPAPVGLHVERPSRTRELVRIAPGSLLQADDAESLAREPSRSDRPRGSSAHDQHISGRRRRPRPVDRASTRSTISVSCPRPLPATCSLAFRRARRPVSLASRAHGSKQALVQVIVSLVGKHGSLLLAWITEPLAYPRAHVVGPDDDLLQDLKRLAIVLLKSGKLAGRIPAASIIQDRAKPGSELRSHFQHAIGPLVMNAGRRCGGHRSPTRNQNIRQHSQRRALALGQPGGLNPRRARRLQFSRPFPIPPVADVQPICPTSIWSSRTTGIALGDRASPCAHARALTAVP